MTDTETKGGEPKFLLVKRDLYYAPDNSGYTGIKDLAGRYHEAEAMPEHGVTAIHQDDAPEYSKGCWHDLRHTHEVGKLNARIAELEANARENAERREDLELEIEELQSHGEAVSAEFEGDCWKAMRTLLTECNFDWGDVDIDGVTAERAREHISTELDELYCDRERQAARIEALEEALRPFADAIDLLTSREVYDPMHVHMPFGLASIRRAAATLTNKGEGKPDTGETG